MLAATLFALVTAFTPAPPASSAVLSVRPDSGEVIAAPARKPGLLRTATREVPVTLVRFDDPALPFVTYLPEGQVAPTVAQTAAGTEVSFVPVIRGRRVEGAIATITFPLAPTTVEALRAATFGTDGVATQQHWQVSDAGVSPCLWAEEGRLVRFDGTRTGFVCVAEYQGTAFRLTVEAPPALTEALGSRLDVLLDELRWRLTGAGLGEF